MLDVIDKISNHELQPFIAPVIKAKKTRVLTIQNQIPYWFYIWATPGWYLLDKKRNSKSFAKVLRNATGVEKIKYLEQLPKFQVITLFIDALNGYSDNDILWVIPFNFADAEQRGWKNGEPRPVYLGKRTILSTDIITVRNLAGTLLYDDVSRLQLDPYTPEALMAKIMIDDRLEQVKKRQVEKERLEKRQSVKGRIDESLKLSGANLIDYKMNTSEEYKIEWMYNGHGYTTTVDKNLRVLSAGVCLDGNDSWHSLNSIVHVMEDRRLAIASGDHWDY